MTSIFSRISRRILGSGNPLVTAHVPQDRMDPAQLIASAIRAHNSGNLAEARQIYEHVLAVDPSNFHALHLLGVVAQQCGDRNQAVELIRQAIAVAPDNPVAHSNLALAYRSLGRLREAESSLRHAVALKPGWDRAHANLGLVLRDSGDLAGAEQSLREAVRLDPGNDEALNNLANVLRESGRFDAAKSLYRQALAIRPDRIECWDNLAALSLDRGEWEQAESCLRKRLELGAPTAEAWSNLGFALSQLGQLAEAEAACRSALDMRPAYPDAIVNLASVRKSMSDIAGAEQLCRDALEIDPAHVSACVNLGTIRRECGDLEGAEALYRRALALQPQSTSARYNLSTLLLLRGEYGLGFELFESRFDVFPQKFNVAYMTRLLGDNARRWRGASLEGRRLLVVAEQGFGDNLMMLRYGASLKRRGAAEVVLLAEPELVRIAATAPGFDRVVTILPNMDPGEFDVHCPAMSLPFCLAAAGEATPEAVPYVFVPDAVANEWRERLHRVTGLRVGVAWAGSKSLRDDAKRSIPLGAFEPLNRVAGATIVSLQKSNGDGRAAGMASWPTEFIDRCSDFLDTAALVTNLDLVIAVDTAVAHLAGALGKPVWLLNRAGSEWRWGLAGERTAWYPTMRIFRQAQEFEWASVLDSVALELQELAQSANRRLGLRER